jgi:DNA-binding transcriptional ArsR family regulator
MRAKSETTSSGGFRPAAFAGRGRGCSRRPGRGPCRGRRPADLCSARRRPFQKRSMAPQVPEVCGRVPRSWRRRGGEAEDVEEGVPEGFGLGGLAGLVGPLAGEGDGSGLDFCPTQRHGQQSSRLRWICIGHATTSKYIVDMKRAPPPEACSANAGRIRHGRIRLSFTSGRVADTQTAGPSGGGRTRQAPVLAASAFVLAPVGPALRRTGVTPLFSNLDTQKICVVTPRKCVVYTRDMDSLHKILSSKVRAEIFRLLFARRDTELHIRELARRSKLHEATLRQDLSKLKELDLVASRRDGNRVYYRANQEHPVYSDIHGLVLKTTGLVEVIRTALEQTDLTVAFVFGSVAAGKESAQSDVDLMVIGNMG